MEIRARTEIVQTSAVNDELVLLQLEVTQTNALPLLPLIQCGPNLSKWAF